MFQATRRRLALWYTSVTAVLLLLFASGFYLYVRHTLVERIDDTLNHVVEVVQRSLVLEPVEANAFPLSVETPLQVNLEASFPRNAEAVEDDHIDLEWFNAAGDLLWSTFSAPLVAPLRLSDGQTVYVHLDSAAANTPGAIAYAAENAPSSTSATPPIALRQVTKQVIVGQQSLGYLRVSHPWFEVTKPSRQLIRDLSLGTVLTVGAVGAIGWLLSGLAIAPVRDSYQHLKQFTADASHELRNPIAVIQTNVQVALADPDPQLQQDQLQVIERLTRRLGRLVDDLLFLARQDSGITPLKFEPVDLTELIQEVLEEQQAIADDQFLHLSFKPIDPISAVNHSDHFVSTYLMQGDRDQLTRLFTNLISNAMQYTPAHGEIEVILGRVKQQGLPHLQIQVRDTGIGIAAEALPHIFDRFYRVDPARPNLESQGRNKPGTSAGSGLGLAITKVIVENHHGQIQVNSTPNQGTTFTITFPGYLSNKS